MFSTAPDASARSYLYSSVFWLVLGATCLALGLIKPVAPDFLTTEVLSYSRLVALGSILLQYGWLTLACLAAVFYIVPRVTGAPVMLEGTGQLAGFLINLAVLVSVPITLIAGVQDHQFSELPPFLDAVLILGLVLAALVIFRTVTARVEERLYPSVYYLVGGVVWAPLALAVGNLHPFGGAPDSVAHLFSVNATWHLFFASVGIGAACYVLPRATGTALYSERLALLGFWVLALAAPMAGQSRAIFGVGQDWLETISIASSIALLVPVVTTLVNFLGTMRGGWERMWAAPSTRLFMGGLALWVVAMAQGTFQSLRSVAGTLGATDAITGQIWLLLLAFTFWSAGLITFALPRLMGKKWGLSTALTGSFWLAFLGAAAIGVGSIAAGLVTSAVWSAGVAVERSFSSGSGFDVVLDSVAPLRAVIAVGALAFAVGAWIYGVVLLRSTTTGERHPVEVVSPPELVP